MLGQGPRKSSFLTDGLMKMSVRVMEESSEVEGKQSGKWFSSEKEIATDDTTEDQLHKDGDVLEYSLLELLEKEDCGFPPD